MNTVPEPLDTAPSLDELAKGVKGVERRARRRTLIVTLSIGFVAILAMMIWSLALRSSVEEAQQQTLITQVTRQTSQIKNLLANDDISASAATKLFQDALAYLSKMPNNPDVSKLQGQVLLSLSDAYNQEGDLGQAASRAIEARNLALTLNESGRGSDAGSELLFDASWRIGDLLIQQGDNAEATAYFETALRTAKTAEMSDPNWRLTFILTKIGDSKLRANQIDEARSAYVEALASATKAAQSDPAILTAQSNLALVHARLAALFAHESNHEQALEQYRVALNIYDNLSVRNPSDQSVLAERATIHRDIGDVLEKQGKPVEAIEQYRLALETFKELTGSQPMNVDFQKDLARTYIRLGDALKLAGQPEDARISYEAALAIQKELQAKTDSDDVRHDIEEAQIRINRVKK